MNLSEIKSRSELRQLTIAELHNTFRALCAQQPKDGRKKAPLDLARQIKAVRDEIIIRKHRA